MTTPITESHVESAALSWLSTLGLHPPIFGPEIASGEPDALDHGPLPKGIAREIMINNIKDYPETET